ncbi:MAG: serD [Dehalococcoidia bacterium]|nr:serD [Dehalococcoidia bacterium]
MTRQWEKARARSAVYEYLSAAFLYPSEDTLAILRNNGKVVSYLMDWLYGEESGAHLLSFVEALSTWTLEEAQEEFTDAFGHIVSTDCPPYEGEYGQAHVFLKSQSLADLAAFYSAFGLEIDPDLKDRMDHISVELEFMHILTMKEVHTLRGRLGRRKVQLCRQAQSSFLKEHLGYWACSFAGRLATMSEGRLYGSLAMALDLFVKGEAVSFDLPVGPEQPIIPEPRIDEDPDCFACPLAVNSDLEVSLP